MCGEECVDTDTDPSNCGGCFNECSIPLCIDGECQGECTPTCGANECGPDGCGGTCGTCETGTCEGGFCTGGCTFPETECDGSCVNTDSDLEHCGGCFNPCETGQICNGGFCETPGGGPGDTCSTATPISGDGGSQTFNFAGLGANHTPFSCGSSSPRPDRVFTFTAPFSGIYFVEAVGAAGDVDTVVAVFSGSLCQPGDEVACDDDGGTGGGSLVEFTATAGASYWVVVAPFSSTTPTGDVTVTVTPEV